MPPIPKKPSPSRQTSPKRTSIRSEPRSTPSAVSRGMPRSASSWKQPPCGNSVDCSANTTAAKSGQASPPGRSDRGGAPAKKAAAARIEIEGSALPPVGQWNLELPSAPSSPGHGKPRTVTAEQRTRTQPASPPRPKDSLAALKTVCRFCQEHWREMSWCH